MKKIIYLIPSLILIVILSECAGYKPIFGSSNLNFIISDYSIEGEKSLGNQFYNKTTAKIFARIDSTDVTLGEKIMPTELVFATSTTNSDGRIKIEIDGTQYYIPIYDV